MNVGFCLFSFSAVLTAFVYPWILGVSCDVSQIAPFCLFCVGLDQLSLSALFVDDSLLGVMTLVDQFLVFS